MRHDVAMNIKAVARSAGVSTATVSRVINKTAFVTPETAERVRNAIAALHFYPDVNARTLGSGRSGLYGLIISDITNPYFPELVKAFEDIAVEHGQEVLIANTDYDAHRMETCVIRMLQRRVDGVAIMTSEMEEHLLQTFASRSIPLVLVDSEARSLEVDMIRLDYPAALRSAIDHLSELGHRDIGFISGPLTLLPARLRKEAFMAELAQRGIALQGSWVKEANHRVDGGVAAVQSMIAAGGSMPTAIVASNDLTAIGAITALRQHGLRVPQDISVVGFDGIHLSAHTHPPLTTLLVPREAIAAAAFRTLLLRKEQPQGDESAPRLQMMAPTLVVRKSTAPPSR